MCRQCACAPLQQVALWVQNRQDNKIHDSDLHIDLGQDALAMRCPSQRGQVRPDGIYKLGMKLTI